VLVLPAFAAATVFTCEEEELVAKDLLVLRRTGSASCLAGISNVDVSSFGPLSVRSASPTLRDLPARLAWPSVALLLELASPPDTFESSSCALRLLRRGNILFRYCITAPLILYTGIQDLVKKATCLQTVLGRS